MLLPALRHRARRLALEVDDHEVVVCTENLAQVVVPVDPDARKSGQDAAVANPHAEGGIQVVGHIIGEGFLGFATPRT